MVCRNTFICRLHHFIRVYWLLLLKSCILDHFCPKIGIFGSRMGTNLIEVLFLYKNGNNVICSSIKSHWYNNFHLFWRVIRCLLKNTVFALFGLHSVYPDFVPKSEFLKTKYIFLKSQLNF